MRAYLGLGSNLGDRAEMLTLAITRLGAAGLVPAAVSPVFETEPQGRRDQGWFLNCVIAIETDLDPAEILRRAQSVETSLGRKHVLHWGPRTIDIDLLLVGDRILRTPELALPHPRLTERAFVLVPLAHLDPNLIIPGHGPVAKLAALRQAEQGQAVHLWGTRQVRGRSGLAATIKPLSLPRAHGGPDTRTALVRMLRDAPNAVSGQLLAKALGISRAAIWKHIHKLREHGYHITGTAGAGYRLEAVPDSLSPDLLLGAGVSVVGRVVHVLRSVDSTNATAGQMARQGSREGTVIVAEEQTQGRGRNGRSFLSPPGGIYISVILRPKIPPPAAGRLTLAAAVAVCQALEDVADVRAQIKWPNDILLPGGKVSGILLELAGREDRVDFVVVGVGVNVLTAPEGVGAISLRQAAGREVRRAEVVQAVVRHLDQTYVAFRDGAWPDLLARWKRRAVTLGQTVRVRTFGEVVAGTAVDVTEDGALVIRQGDSLRTVLAGDVETVRQEPI